MADDDKNPEHKVPGLEMTERELRLHLAERAMQVSGVQDHTVKMFADEMLDFVMSEGNKRA